MRRGGPLQIPQVAEYGEARPVCGGLVERAKLLAAQAERWRLRNAESTGELVRAADVEREWTGILRLVRSRLLAVGQRHPGADADIRQALAELAGDGGGEDVPGRRKRRTGKTCPQDCGPFRWSAAGKPVTRRHTFQWSPPSVAARWPRSGHRRGRHCRSGWNRTSICRPGSPPDPGPLRLWAFQRGIADAIGDPEVERVSVLKSARVGFTTCCAARSRPRANDPSPDPRGDADRIRLPRPRGGRPRAAVRRPRLAGGDAAGAACATSATADTHAQVFSRRHHQGREPPRRREISAGTPPAFYLTRLRWTQATAGKAEGDPISLAERRTLSFADRKIVAGGTPQDENLARSAGCTRRATSACSRWRARTGTVSSRSHGRDPVAGGPPGAGALRVPVLRRR